MKFPEINAAVVESVGKPVACQVLRSGPELLRALAARNKNLLKRIALRTAASILEAAATEFGCR